MRFVVTGEWRQNQLLRLILACFLVFVVLLWGTNAALFLGQMGFSYDGIVRHYLGDEATFSEPRSFKVLLEISHFHLFAMGMLLLVLTHLMLFVPLGNATKAWLIAVPFLSAVLDEGASWLVRFVHPGFAVVKIAGFLLLQASLAALILVSLWAVFAGSQRNYSGGSAGPP